MCKPFRNLREMCRRKSVIALGGAILVVGIPWGANASGLGNRSGSSADRAAETVDVAAAGKRVGYQTAVQSTCPSVSVFCQVEVISLNETQSLDVTNLSCLLKSIGAPIYVILYDDDFDSYFVPRATASGFAVFNSPVRANVSPGSTLELLFRAETDAQVVTCKVAGEMTIAQ
jgi:hypothetical protein